MKKINWRRLNAAFWTEVLLTYLLPFKVIDHFAYKAGFPMQFLTVYNTEIGINPMMSMSMNPVVFLVNGIIIYLVISACVKVYHKFKPSHQQAA